MIEDCQAGKIDLIITKSVSRFARNILDCIGHVRELAKLKPPIGVFFETENLYTLDPNSENMIKAGGFRIADVQQPRRVSDNYGFRCNMLAEAEVVLHEKH